MSHGCSLVKPSLRISVNNTPERAGFFQVYAYIDELGRKQMPRFAGGGRLIKLPLQHISYGQNTPSAVTPHQIYTRSTRLSHKTNKIVDEPARYAKLTGAALKMHLGVPACSQKKHFGSLQLAEGMRLQVAAAGVTQSGAIGRSG
jgi:hypothetical protein